LGFRCLGSEFTSWYKNSNRCCSNPIQLLPRRPLLLIVNNNPTEGSGQIKKNYADILCKVTISHRMTTNIRLFPLPSLQAEFFSETHSSPTLVFFIPCKSIVIFTPVSGIFLQISMIGTQTHILILSNLFLYENLVTEAF
jgi:hypothetical protein